MKVKNKGSQANNGPITIGLGLGRKHSKGVHTNETDIDAVCVEKRKRPSPDQPAVGRFFSYAVKSVALCALVIVYPQLTFAETTTISGDLNVTQGPTTPPLNGDDSLIITPTGSITTAGQVGQDTINASGNNNTITNHGTLSSTQSNSYSPNLGRPVSAISATGNSNSIVNSSTIITNNQNLIHDSYGVSVNGSLNSITNSGSIVTNGDSAYGIYASGDSNTIANIGNLTVAGGSDAAAYGIKAFGSYNTINSLGKISLAVLGGTTSYAISAEGGYNSIANSGSIDIAGAYGAGIQVIGSGGSNTITNSGVISSSGGYGSSISIGDGNTGSSSNTIINYGLISALVPSNASEKVVYAFGDSNTIINFGSMDITGSGLYNYVINLTGNSGKIVNSGSISISGGASSGTGIYADGVSNAITNAGSISISGNFSTGIFASGNSSTITSTGSIGINGNSSAGVLAFGDSSAIANTGSINVSGPDGNGIFSYGNANSVTNSGAISVSGARGYGVQAQGDSNAITNTGSINVSGSGSYGIYAQGSNNTVTNSGDIISQNGYAIYFNGSGNTFNSVNNFISGGIYMGSNAIVSLTTGANYSKLYTFEGSLSAINGSGPVPLFKNLATQQAGTYDPTLLASSSDALADMTTTISSLIPGRFNGSDNQHPVWAKGFGIKSSYAGTAATLDRNYSFSGVAIGYDAMRTQDLTLGVMGGYGQSGLTADGKTAQSFNTASDDGFMGLYGQKRWKNVAVDFALYGGVQSFQQQRYVNDNLAYLGNASAKASYQGWWISPEAGVTYDAGQISGWSILPTARLRYAQQWMAGYSESGGGSANATVNGRSVAIGQSFIGLGTRKTIKTNLGKDTKMVLDGQIGYIYRGVVGDNTAGVTMIGQSLALPTESSSRSAVALSAGVTLDLSNAVALKIRGDFEAGGGMNYVGGGWAGLSVKF